MNTSPSVPLTPELERALDAQGGILQSPDYVLMRPDAFFGTFGFASDRELRDYLQPALDQIDRGDVAEWDVEAFLRKMNAGK